MNAMTYGNGTAIAEVEVDINTAAVKVTRIVFVHDAGNIINPIIAEGQVAGGIAHGIGNALYEWMGYDDQGQPLTTTLADYLLITISEMPVLDLAHRETPTPLNPLGVKGIGESGVLPFQPPLLLRWKMPCHLSASRFDSFQFGRKISRKCSRIRARRRVRIRSPARAQGSER